MTWIYVLAAIMSIVAFAVGFTFGWDRKKQIQRRMDLEDFVKLVVDKVSMRVVSIKICDDGSILLAAMKNDGSMDGKIFMIGKLSQGVANGANFNTNSNNVPQNNRPIIMSGPDGVVH